MRTHAISVIAAAVLLLLAGFAHAQAYRCKAPDGKVVYQQIACSAGDVGEKIKIQRQPSQTAIAEAQSRLRLQEAATANAAYERAAFDEATTSRAGQGSALYSISEPQHEVPRSSEACPPGQVPLNPSGSDPSSGWSSSKGYVPLRCGSANRQASTSKSRTGPGITEPKRVQDQYGNFYQQPPGSGFAIDERTGKQCFVYGDFVKCD